jgi:ABC-2 type transport system ATP-binding protein
MEIKINQIEKIFTTTRRKGLISFEKIHFKALSDVSLNLQNPTILTIIGANGAGKTTLIKLMTGLISPTKGNIEINGFNPYQRTKKYLKQIGFVSGQKRVLNPDLNPFDSIFSTCLFYDMEIELINSRFEELVKLFNVEHKTESLVRNLSLGENIKFEIILAIMHKPKLLFLDEPTIGLDFESQKIIITTLKKLHSEEKTTIILTSHYPKDIKELSKDVLILEKGCPIFFGKFEDLEVHKGDDVNIYINQLNEELEAYERNI